MEEKAVGIEAVGKKIILISLNQAGCFDKRRIIIKNILWIFEMIKIISFLNVFEL